MRGARLIERLSLAARTARHLRPSQLVYWPLRRLQQRLPPPAAPREAATLSRLAPNVAAAVVRWGAGDAEARVRRADEVRGGVFRFLDHAERLARVDWTRRYVSHLWSYHLQYFDYATDLAWAARLTGDAGYADTFVRLAESWCDGTTQRRGDAWDSYTLSLRAVNWSYALMVADEWIAATTRERLWRSVYAQLAHLAARLERHLLANHYQRNLRALHLGGLLFDGPRAAGWRRVGTRLWSELLEQVLADGTHFERAPMYHATALGDYLEALSIARAAGARPLDEARIAERLARACDALTRLSRPDGTLHLFNDSADGAAPPQTALDALARDALGRPLRESLGSGGEWSLPEGGFFGWQDAAGGERFVIDCGAVGPEYQPGHAHCDVLSFELDFDGRRAIVDSGLSGYEGDPLREYVRSTRAHNTVAVDGREQSELWGTFRVARRAQVRRGEIRREAGYTFSFDGAYQPYWDAGVLHSRRVRRFDDEARWEIEDRVHGCANAPIVSYLHLHPSLTVVEATRERIVARYADGAAVAIEPRGVAAVRVRQGAQHPPQGWYCPQFGVAIAAPALELDSAASDGEPFGYEVRYVPRGL